MIRMTPIIPKNRFTAAQLDRIVENTLNQSALACKVDFEVTAQTWNHRPGFSIDSKPGERIVGTDDTIYGYVNDGTRPHMIYPRRARRLAFASGYRAKTRPGSISSSSGGSSGGTVFARAVHHPGTKARSFTKAIAKKWQQLLPQQMQRAINAEVSH